MVRNEKGEKILLWGVCWDGQTVNKLIKGSGKARERAKNQAKGGRERDFTKERTPRF